jgi:hypothetical protein
LMQALTTWEAFSSYNYTGERIFRRRYVRRWVLSHAVLPLFKRHVVGWFVRD